MLRELQNYPALVQAVLRYDHRSQMGLDQFKVTLSLIDGSQLRINEVWLDGELAKYAYYWLTPTGSILSGWDNAPHHPQVGTFPHHRHVPEDIVPSQIRSVTDVLDFLASQLLPDDK